jgi:hypothetical protein
MKNLTPNADRHITLVLETLKPSTRKPKKPSDRQPRLHQTPRKSNGCVDALFVKPNEAADQELSKLHLSRSFITMIGSYLERSPKANETNRSTLRDVIKHTEICLGLRDGKLTASQFGMVLTMLDTIAEFKDGDLTGDWEALEAIVQDYGAELAGEKNRV